MYMWWAHKCAVSWLGVRVKQQHARWKTLATNIPLLSPSTTPTDSQDLQVPQAGSIAGADNGLTIYTLNPHSQYTLHYGRGRSSHG